MILPEIVDQVLGFLHSDKDYTTLEACSVVFPDLADYHLYSQITFSNPTSFSLSQICGDEVVEEITYSIDPTQFSLILADRPYVANYVRIVRIIVEKRLLVTPEQNFTLSVIASILPKLSQIEATPFTSTGPTGPVPWSILDSSFRTALENAIRLPSNKKVTVARISYFPHTQCIEEAGQTVSLRQTVDICCRCRWFYTIDRRVIVINTIKGEVVVVEVVRDFSYHYDLDHRIIWTNQRPEDRRLRRLGRR